MTVSQIVPLAQSSSQHLFLCSAGWAQIYHCLLPAFLSRFPTDINRGTVKMGENKTHLLLLDWG